MKKQKITFIFAFEDTEKWSTPISLVLAFQHLGWDTEAVSIGSNRTGIYSEDALREWVRGKVNSDIVLFMDWGRFDSPLLNKILHPNSFWIQESGDDPQNFNRNSPKSNRFNLTFTPDYDSYTAYQKLGVNTVWIPHFACIRTQYPLGNVPQIYTAVTTRGIGNSPLLDTITEWGEGSIGNRNGMEWEAHTKFLNSGLMVIQNSRWGEVTRRIFEGMACGKLVITDRLDTSKKLEELFVENDEIILYDSIHELAEKINYYAQNDEERSRIALNGHRKVLNNYTSDHVAQTLINEYNKWKN